MLSIMSNPCSPRRPDRWRSVIVCWITFFVGALLRSTTASPGPRPSAPFAARLSCSCACRAVLFTPINLTIERLMLGEGRRCSNGKAAQADEFVACRPLSVTRTSPSLTVPRVRSSLTTKSHPCHFFLAFDSLRSKHKCHHTAVRTLQPGK
jgi:hypothetical protein